MPSTYQLYALSAYILIITYGCLAENNPLPRNCQDIRKQGHYLPDYYVVYQTVKNNSNHATMVYCDENDGMQETLEGKDQHLLKTIAINCQDAYDQGHTHDGHYIIYPFTEHPETPVLALCDQTTDGGGWSVISLRDEDFVDRLDFQKTFDEYAAGFGDVNYDFYMGNEFIHSLTDASMNELWVDIEKEDRSTGYAHYQYFHVGPKVPDVYNQPTYIMDCGFYEGTIGDGMGGFNGMGFTTTDEDHDIWNQNCATKFGGGWWFRSCLGSNLNGLYGDQYFSWQNIEEVHRNLRAARMMVRPSSSA